MGRREKERAKRMGGRTGKREEEPGRTKNGQNGERRIGRT